MTSLRVSSGARPSHGVTHRALAALISSMGSSDRANGRRGSDIQGARNRGTPRSPRLGTVGCGFSVTLETAHKIAAEIRAAGTMP